MSCTPIIHSRSQVSRPDTSRPPGYFNFPGGPFSPGTSASCRFSFSPPGLSAQVGIGANVNVLFVVISGGGMTGDDLYDGVVDDDDFINSHD